MGAVMSFRLTGPIVRGIVALDFGESVEGRWDECGNEAGEGAKD